MTGGADLTDQFIDEGIWWHGFEDDKKIQAQVRAMQTGSSSGVRPSLSGLGMPAVA